jgi:endonuclease/exonuclease/phosphatase family metal-dependent hydrolase
VFNAFLPVPSVLRYYGQPERVPLIAPALANTLPSDLDALVVNEVIPPSYLDQITRDFAEKLHMPFRSQPLQDGLIQNSGIFVFSKHPIVSEARSLFGPTCEGADCLSAKGVAYARLRLPNATHVNVFATHLQSGHEVSHIKLREAQIAQTREFMEQAKLPSNEPVLFCGDLNTDRHDSALVTYFNHLDLQQPNITPDSHPFTIDPSRNPWVGLDDPESYKTSAFPSGCVSQYLTTKHCPCCEPQWYDYVTYSTTHLQPVSASVKAIEMQIASPIQMSFTALDSVVTTYVSDHFPVLAELDFGSLPSNPHQDVNVLNEPTSTNSVLNGLFVSAIVVVITLFIVGASAIGYYARKNAKSAATPLK